MPASAPAPPSPIRSVPRGAVGILALLFAFVGATIGMEAAGQPASGSLVRHLTLAECVLLAVKNNRNLASGRLGRQAQQLTLEDAEDEFFPTPAIDLSLTRDSMASAPGREMSSTLDISPGVSLRIPTGGVVSVNANNVLVDQDSASPFVTLRFTQPLLRGAGIAVGTADVARARRAERIGFLAFKSTVIDVVTRTVYAYRAVTSAMQTVDVAERSLRRAHELLAVNRILIETGRMAEQDVVQTEASVAERELSLTVARDALSDARLALSDLLADDSQVPVVPTEPLRVEPSAQDADESVGLAFENRPDWLQALLSLENAKVALLVADNSRKWQLDLTGSARVGHGARPLSEAYSALDDDYRVGLRLDVPIGVNKALRERVSEKARISLQQSEIRLAELRQAIDLGVRNAVRDVETHFRRAELAKQASALAQRKLDVERTKLNSGRSSNFRLVRFEDDLVRSQNNEIRAIIAYQNSLTALDRIRGTTLGTWRIEVEPAADPGGLK